MPDQTPATPKAKAAPGLPPKLEKAIADWENGLAETLAPHLTTQAWNSLTELRANLRAAIAAALS